MNKNADWMRIKTMATSNSVPFLSIPLSGTNASIQINIIFELRQMQTGCQMDSPLSHLTIIIKMETDVRITW